jgi:hypothetical protein
MDETPGHLEWIKQEADNAAHQRLTRLSANDWPKIAAELSKAYDCFVAEEFTPAEAMQLLLAFVAKGQ